MSASLQAYIGLGANVGDGRTSLEHAVGELAALPGAALTGVSRLYRTRPVGPVAQDDYWNAVVGLRLRGAGQAAAAALDLLAELKRIERQAGRRERLRWGPRELDLDLLIFGDHAIRAERPASARSDDPTRAGRQWLEVPHPHAAARLFVLAPLADLDPDLRPPGWALTVSQARDRARSLDGEESARVVAAWDASARRWGSTT